MASSGPKLKALLKKNILEMKRNLGSTICQILFPIILMFLLYVLKTLFDVETKEFLKEEKGVLQFMEKRGIANLNYYTRNLSNITLLNSNLTNETIEFLNVSTNHWNGLRILPALRICGKRLKDADNKKVVIASINIPEEIKLRLIEESKLFQPYLMGFNLTLENFTNFSSIEEMNKHLQSSSYGSDENPSICFGMSFFEGENEKGKEYNYSLHYFENAYLDGADDVPNTLYILDQFQNGPDMESYEKYQENGYTYIMKVIADYILRKTTNNDESEISFGVMPMKYKSYRNDLFAFALGYLGPFFIIIGYMGHLCMYVYKMVLEKETKAKEGMKIMGLTDGIYFLSYAIEYFCIAFFDAIVNGIIFHQIFKRVPYEVLFFLFFLFALNIFALAYFFQSFIDQAKQSLMIAILLYFIMFFLSYLVADDNSSYAMKVGLSFFPPVTIDIGMILLGKFESHFRTFHSKDSFEVYTNYSIIIMFVMLCVDLIIYLFLGYYFENVLPHDYGVRKPWYFLCKSCFKKKKQIYNANANAISSPSTEEEGTNINGEDDILGNLPINNPNSDNFQSEDIYKNMTKPTDVLKIRNLVKQFGDGKVAVDHVDLNFYKNEIFALLGHNGAGKTTMISILTGLYQATSGEAIYDGKNVLSPENVDEFREKVGICPQHDILFGDLSIREHLGMFGIFKGVKSEDLEKEVDKSVSDFQFEEIQNMVAKNLSAGQRRKLSIAISLIGGSQIIFLDEPSSGMDITSRRNLWEILKRQSDNKIIILTTHYMEEASVLGKRIGIINLGKMKCIGTPLFLIEKFGKYMSITLSKDEGANNDKIMSYISQQIGQPQFESLSEEIIARVEKNAFSKESGISLNKFFEDLDANLEQLKIKSYSVSMPTLEDVFLNIAAEDESQRISQIIREEEKYDKILFDSDYLDSFENKSKFWSDFKANFWRRFYLMTRDKKGILMEILCPILLVIVGAIISTVSFSRESPEFTSHDVSEIGKQIIYYAQLNNSQNISEDYFIKHSANISSKIFDDYYNLTSDLNITDEENKTIAIERYINKFYDQTIHTESSGDNEVDMNADDYVGYFGSFLLLNETEENETNLHKYEFFELINARVTQGVPLFTSAFLEKVLNKAAKNVGQNITVNFKNKAMVNTFQQEETSNSASKGTIVVFVAIAFSLIPANFITIIVKEKNNNSKHIMRLSGINIVSYWLVNFIYELVKYYFTGGIILLILKIGDYDYEYIWAFYIILGPALISVTYVISFFFTDDSNAQNKMILINTLISVLGGSTVVVLRANESTANLGKQLQVLFGLLPSFNFCFAYNIFFNKIIIYMVDYKDEWMSFGSDHVLIEKMNLQLGLVVYLIVEIFLYFGILVLIEYITYSNTFKSTKNDELLEVGTNRDDGVVREEARAKNEAILSNEKLASINTPLESLDTNEENLINADNIEPDLEGQKQTFKIRIKFLRKMYKKSIYKIFKCLEPKGRVAVKNLSFCVEKGECFGLLGLNGAGKTTTFKCITQEITPDNGEIYIDGVKTNNNFDLINHQFGYCPQYDAIFEYLTVFENLEYYSKIRGVKPEVIGELVSALIREMRLQEFTNKMSGRLSGGNKRKLSVAISMLCNPPIILLDEPSTGMDPEARRFMWSVIHKMSTKGKRSSIIMTTHSMDEAETLCKRMAIMVNGEFVCMGKANEIKEKYGYGYELNLRIKPMTDEQQNEIYQKYGVDKNLTVKLENLDDVLKLIHKENFRGEINDGRLGEKLLRDIEKNHGVNISAVLSWIFYVQNAIRFVEYGRNNFAKIVVEENMDNNFLFKMKKIPNETKSIGYLFGLYETHKDECYITEYSIDQTSLEQIFNKFAESQSSMLSERRSTIVEDGDVENIFSGERRKVVKDKEGKIVLTELLSEELVGGIMEG